MVDVLDFIATADAMSLDVPLRLVDITEPNSSPVTNNVGRALLICSLKLPVLAYVNEPEQQSEERNHDTYSRIGGTAGSILWIMACCGMSVHVEIISVIRTSIAYLDRSKCRISKHSCL